MTFSLMLGFDDFEDDAGKNLKMLVSMQLCNLVDLTSALRHLRQLLYSYYHERISWTSLK